MQKPARRRSRRDAEIARPDGLRERKKLATRQRISDLATRLFTERGFDRVTIDEVAAAANVSKMTVFNYFARKEDLLFDRDDEVPQLVRDALARRGRRSPLAALQALAHDLIDTQYRLAKVTPRVAGFWKVVSDSPALRARTRELNEELERDLGRMLAETIGARTLDPVARLIAAVLLGAWRVAFREALRRQRTRPAAATKQLIRELLDRGFAAAKAAAGDSPYV
jgi:AcrR family transcriptional regulator